MGALSGASSPPEVLDQPIARDELVRVQQKDGQQHALSAAADGDQSIAVHDFEWAKYSDFHVAPLWRRYHGFRRRSYRSLTAPYRLQGAYPDA